MNSRKRSSKVSWDKIIVVLISALILILIIALAVNVSSRNSHSRQVMEENVSLRQEIEEWESYFDHVKAEKESEMGDAETLGTDSDGTDSSETAPPETTAPATTAPPETEPEKLTTLDGIAAGTELGREKLDLENPDKYFEAYEIKTTGACYQRINGKSYKENPDVKLSDLRYLKVLHYNFNHQLQVGELIVNKGLADDVLSIFRELYDAEYEIYSMHLVDNYWTGDGVESDSASIDVNNTSAFNYRPAVGSGKLSNHAYGCAIDINPQQNPYVSYSSGKAKWSHSNANDYIARDTGLPHVITHDDTAFKIFTAYGFKWGGDWNNPKDYQHFEKRLK